MSVPPTHSRMVRHSNQSMTRASTIDTAMMISASTSRVTQGSMAVKASWRDSSASTAVAGGSGSTVSEPAAGVDPSCCIPIARPAW